MDKDMDEILPDAKAYRSRKRLLIKKVPVWRNFSLPGELLYPPPVSGRRSCGQGDGRMKDKTKVNDVSMPYHRQRDDGLGPNSDIGNRLRTLYGAVQDEGIPDKLLDLLEKLDQVEKQSQTQRDE